MFNHIFKISIWTSCLILAFATPVAAVVQITNNGYKISEVSCNPGSCKVEIHVAEFGREMVTSKISGTPLVVYLEWYDFTSEKGRVLVAKHTKGSVTSAYEVQVWFKGLPKPSSVSFKVNCLDQADQSPISTYVMHDLATRQLDPQMPVDRSDLLTFGSYLKSQGKVRIELDIKHNKGIQKIAFTATPLAVP